MRNFLLLPLGLILLLGYSCSKEDKSLPVSSASDNTAATPAPHTTFIFTGTMLVDKSDSLWAPVTNYTATNVISTVFGTSPNYSLSTSFNATALKGQTDNVIPVTITNNYFSTFVTGTGIFNQGVLNGFYSNDSLYYRVLYKGVNKSNVFLDFKGKLTSSH